MLLRDSLRTKFFVQGIKTSYEQILYFLGFLGEFVVLKERKKKAAKKELLENFYDERMGTISGF